MDDMRNYRNLDEYSILEINDVLESLRQIYDRVQLVDVEESRVLHVQPDGSIHYGQECFKIWKRDMRCARCAGYQACMTHQPIEKVEIVDGHKQMVRSIPIYLEMLDGELELCVMDCVKVSPEIAPQETHTAVDELTYISTHDALTGLYTQEKLFHEIRQRLINYPKDSYMIVMGNIRNFKLVNKLFGEEGGNRILLGVADILRQDCTHEEVYGRCRDDRFVVLVRKDKFSEKKFLRHLEKVKGLVGSPIYSLQIQMGIYEITDINMPISAMLDHADLALSTIRDFRSRHIVHYREGMMERKLRDQQLITQFEQDLLEHHFHIFLQPQVTAEGLICGGEALVRWIRPNGTIVQPMEFLHVLRESGLLSHLDVYVWECAVRQLAVWTGTEFENLYISINVDPADFYYTDVPGLLKDLCKKYDVPTRKLRVEVTETAVVGKNDLQEHIVEQLHEAGFLVEIDDFGKGSSSLSMLKDVHADVLKIDMGFVRGKNTQSRGKVIIESVIDMADQLSMSVITEGVETRGQVEDLIRAGCRNFQGFYFSRPIPIPDFEAVVHAQNEKLRQQSETANA